ncbi:MAG TPA: HDIG domain-containing protein [Syntrophales bacterium]|nr:HDIG domain-containing protein [Syntrophales bacterium]
MTRDEAAALLARYVKNENMIRHSLAAEAVLRALARRLGRDEEKWGLAGLLHDIDIEQVGGDLAVHGLAGEKILSENGCDPEIVEAVRMHNEAAAGACRSKEFHHALAAGETITGLITATALVYPDRKLAGVKVKSVTKRMKEKAFAASVNRGTVLECEKIGLPLDEFACIALSAMQGISGELGL